MSEDSPAPSTETAAPAAPCAGCGSPLELVLAAWLLRIWLGLRALLTGVEKYAGAIKVKQPLLDEFGQPDITGAMVEVEQKTYGLQHYHGVPEALGAQFKGQPLLPEAFLPLYDKMLGPALIALGLLTLLGIFKRLSLFAMGLLYTSLTYGLILIKQDAGVAWLGIHLALIAMALALSKHDRISLTHKL